MSGFPLKVQGHHLGIRLITMIFTKNRGVYNSPYSLVLGTPLRTTALVQFIIAVSPLKQVSIAL